MTDAGRTTGFRHAAGRCLRRLPAFLAVPALYFGGLVAAAMFASLVDPPGARQAPETCWVELRFVESLEIVGLLTAAAFVAMVAGGARDRMRGRRVDLRLHPVPRRVRAVFSSALPRAVLAVGAVMVAGHLAARFAAPRLLGQLRNGLLWPTESTVVCLAWAWGAMWFHPHEAVHSYQRSRNLFLHEGLAEAFGTSFFYSWSDACDGGPEMTIHALHEGMDRVAGLGRSDRVVAGNFIRWLFHRHGPSKMVAAAREAYLEGSRTRAVLARVYGMPFEDLAAQWQRDQEWLGDQEPPAGFFVKPPWDARAPAGVNGAATGEP